MAMSYNAYHPPANTTWMGDCFLPKHSETSLDVGVGVGMDVERSIAI